MQDKNDVKPEEHDNSFFVQSKEKDETSHKTHLHTHIVILNFYLNNKVIKQAFEERKKRRN